MILESIKLNNIRSYADEEVRFPPGSVLLSGDIGSGKSSVLLAVEFAIFGIGKGMLSGESLLRNGKKEGYVELKFLLDSKSVVIRRTLKRIKSGVAQASGYLLIDGTKHEGTAVELKSRILDLLGYPMDTLTKKSLVYRYTVYTPQEDMKRILFEESEERLDTLRRIFGIDRYKRVKENVELYIRSLRERHTALSERLSDFDSKINERKEKEKLGDELSTNISHVEILFKSIKRELDEKQKVLKEYEIKSKEFAELKKDVELCEISLKEKLVQRSKNNDQLASLQSNLDELDSRIKAINIHSVPVAEDDIENSIKKKEEKLSSLIVQSSSVRERLSSAKEMLIRLEKEVSEKITSCKELPILTARQSEIKEILSSKKSVVKDSEDAEKLLQKLSLDMRELETKIENSLSIKSNVSKLGTCPSCLQAVPKEHKHVVSEQENFKIEKLNSELGALNKERSNAASASKSAKQKLDGLLILEKEFERINSDVRNFESISNEIISKRKHIAELRETKAELEERLVDEKVVLDLKNELESLKNILKKVNDAKVLQREKEHMSILLSEKAKLITHIEDSQSELKRQVGQINLKKRSLQDELENFKDVDINFVKERFAFDELKAKEKEIEIKKATLLKELEGISKLLDSLNEEINARLKLKYESLYISKLRQWLDEHFVGLVGLIEKHVMVSVHREFDELFRNWFAMLMEDDSLSVRLDDSFKPVVIQNGFETDLENLSGGEKTSAALAYRLSLNKVVNDLIGLIKTKELIILDEPTDGFSSEQLDKVKLVLEELNVKQIILVSHEAKIESFVDNVIRIAKDEHVSRVVS